MLEHSAEARRFYKSARWRRCRESYILSVYGLCERCNGPGYIVHHKEYINASNIDDPNVTLNHDNLEYLCLPCHNKEHFGGVEVIRDGLMFNNDGDLIRV